jgi:formate dehydrogenase assembly factor FdhD
LSLWLLMTQIGTDKKSTIDYVISLICINVKLTESENINRKKRKSVYTQCCTVCPFHSTNESRPMSLDQWISSLWHTESLVMMKTLVKSTRESTRV